jgi:hypothetical protein
MTFAARPLTLRFAADVGSLILAVGLPQMFSFVRQTKLPSAPLPLMDFARIVLGLVKPNVVLRTCIISGSFPLDDNKQTKQSPSPLDHSQSPAQISGFHVPHAYARLHTPRMSLLSDVLFSERLARQGPPLFFHCPLSVITQPFTMSGLHKQPWPTTAFLSLPVT